MIDDTFKPGGKHEFNKKEKGICVLLRVIRRECLIICF